MAGAIMKLNSEKKFDSIFSDDRFLCTVAAAIIGSAVVGGVLSSNSSSKAADTQLQASQDATATQRDMFNTVNKQQEPWRQAGSNALSSISNGFGLSVPTGDYNQQVGGVGRGQFNHSFDANDLKTNLAPNYDFQLQQGLGAVNNQASVTGGLVGGNALKGINDYAQGYAGNAYQQAFNNYNTNQTNIYNRLSNIAGLGQTANGQTAQAGTTIAGNIGSAQVEDFQCFYGRESL